MGGLLGAVAGSQTGSQIGEQLDGTVFDRMACQDCGHTFNP
jgi:hypothetical protein